jgi:ATP-dependent RNA helicase DeaD
MVTYRIEVGRNDDVSPKNIVGAIANEADIDAQFIGHITLHDDHSTVDLPEGMPKELFDHLYKVRVCQKPLKLSIHNRSAGEQRRTKPAGKGKKNKPAAKGKPKAHRGADSKPRKPRKRPAADQK